MAKLLNNSYIYNKFPQYEKTLFMALNNANVVDKDSESFNDIKYEVKKRQISNNLIKVLESPSVVLLYEIGVALPKQFKVFVAKDIKHGSNVHKVYIDCSNLIYTNGGEYRFTNPGKSIEILIAYLVEAMSCLLYYKDEKRIMHHSDIMKYGADCFAKLFSSVVDYIYKISVNGNTKARCMYLAAMYYLVNILGNEINDGCRRIAKNISGLSDREEEIIEMQITQNTFANIKTFVESCGDILKLNNMTLDIIVDKWMKLYGVGTVLALELFTCFAGMISAVYIGCYINQQKAIEKICGRSMIEFTKAILLAGEGAF